jgi:peptide deformylase
MPAKKQLPTVLPVDLYDLTPEDKRRFGEEQALGMVAPQHPVLVGRSAVIDPKLIQSTLFQHMVERLLHVAGSQQNHTHHEQVRRTLVGLAAPQIGEPWRMIAVDTEVSPDRKRSGKLECFINPEIVWRSRELQEGREGCFSAGPVWGLVRRAVAVKIRAYNPDGQKVERIFEDFTARIVQHEIDHLDGIRFPERIRSDKKRHWVHAEEVVVYPELIQHWPRLCTRQRWDSFKLSATNL